MESYNHSIIASPQIPLHHPDWDYNYSVLGSEKEIIKFYLCSLHPDHYMRVLAEGKLDIRDYVARNAIQGNFDLRKLMGYTLQDCLCTPTTIMRHCCICGVGLWMRLEAGMRDSRKSTSHRAIDSKIESLPSRSSKEPGTWICWSRKNMPIRIHRHSLKGLARPGIFSASWTPFLKARPIISLNLLKNDTK